MPTKGSNAPGRSGAGAALARSGRSCSLSGMKTRTNILLSILVAALAVTGCKKNASGPVAAADEPSGTSAETAEAPAVVKSDALYDTASPTAAVKVGEPSEVALKIEPSDGFKINKEFRWNFEFHPSDAVEFESAKISSDALALEDAGATIPLKLTAKSAGEHKLKATGDFSVCNEDKCELYRDQEVAFTLQAEDG